MSILEAIEAQARAWPERTAFEGEHGPVTYGQLVTAVDELASALRMRLPSGTRIALASQKTPGTVAGMLAVLAAGCAYVPIDVTAPLPRRQFLARDAQCGLALTADDVDLGLDLPALSLPRLAETRHRRARPGWHRADPGGEAYVLYTSGSTGTPKGVVISHRNALAFVRWAARAYPLAPGDRVAVHAPLFFDLPVYDIYVGLAGGATLFLIPERVALFPQAVLRFLIDNRITHLYAVPSALSALVHRAALADGGLPDLRRLLYAGEEFRVPALTRLLAAAPRAEAVNLYGPIETNVVTSFAVPRERLSTLDRIPLGRPVDGATIALHDGRTASERRAMEGELLVAGDCVTPGYLSRPDLTAAATLELNTESGRHRFYRTGDFVRRDTDGVLHLLGRRDGLVKTRGYRVELSDVECSVGGHPGVAEVAVVAVPDPEVTHRLHAFVVPRAGYDRAALPGEILRHCRASQPGYLVPGAVHIRDDLPRTSTGKIHRASLPDLLEAEA